MFDENAEKEFLKKRKYNEEGFRKVGKQKKEDECPFSNYPKELDAVEFMEFLNGKVHIADYYTINHDQDNFISLTP